MKLIFFGSDDFALVNLEALLSAKQDVVAVVTQPDRQQGRGMKVVPPVIKERAQSSNIPVLQPENVGDSAFHDELKQYDADLFIVIAYGRILPTEVLDIPKIMPINVHGSLLPQYRGAAPINWAIINGDTKTGVTVIKMSARMDAGDIIATRETDIGETETAGELRTKMAKLSAELLLDTLPKIESNAVEPVEQDISQISYAGKIEKQHCAISWGLPSAKIVNLVRGLSPRPAAFTICNGKKLKILSAISESGSGQPGQILDVTKEGIAVAAGVGAVVLQEVHPESSKKMDAMSFAAGQRLKIGDILG